MTRLDQHRILVDCQHGFRKKRSFESQLLITTHDLAVIMNNHSQADTAVLDFAKAFDKVPHRRLLVKLKHYNLNQQVIGWIKSFLSTCLVAHRELLWMVTYHRKHLSYQAFRRALFWPPIVSHIY